jgi:DnaJ-class molecular chaperone
MSLYEELELTETCTKDEIKKSYRRLAMLHHPDKGGNEEKFKKISSAYETLFDDNKRRDYDNSKKSTNFGSFNNMDDILKSFGRGFPFFKINPGNKTHQNKVSINYDLELELREVYLGCVKDIVITYNTNCSCYTICPYCRGQGKTQNMIRQGPFVQMYEKICDVCIGKGYSVKANCEECDEIGKYEKTSKLKITFHPKIMCKKIIVPLSREQVKNEIEVIINVKIKKDLLFEVKESGSGSINLIYKTEIDFVDSICGKDITIPHPKENITLNTYEKFGIIEQDKQYIIPNMGFRFETGIEEDNEEIGELIIIFKINYSKKQYTQEDREQLRKLLM